MNQWTQKRQRRVVYQTYFKNALETIKEVIIGVILLWSMYILLGFIYSL